MVAVTPIRTGEHLQRALARIDEIFDAPAGTPEGDELDLLSDLVELYELKRVPAAHPSPAAAIEFRMEQQGLSRRDLIPYLGSRAKVSEVLSGKRPITMAMARALHRYLGIPADVLLQEPGAAFDATFDDLDASRFPLKVMAKRGWIPALPDLAGRAEELVAGLIERAGGRAVALAPLYRKNDQHRINAKTDDYALRAWCWQVMAAANAHPPAAAYRPGTVSPAFMREVAQLSPHDDGPIRARALLNEHGIGLEVVRHLPRTHLDGAALRGAGGRPVIGLTLRYDRIDNFWFCLLHELAHVGLHLEGDGDDAFVDDLSLRDAAGAPADSKERAADALAEEALIPRAMWGEGPAPGGPTVMRVISLAREAGVHPAVVAGRVRHEAGNYRLLSQFVGSGQVRRHFEVEAARLDAEIDANLDALGFGALD